MTPRLFASIAGVEARRLMSYRADFWFTAVGAFLVDIVIAWFLWSALFAESGRGEIAGFSRQGMVLYYVIALLLGKLVRGEERQSTVARDIYEGALTRYILYPQRYFACKYAEHVGALAPALVQLAVLGLGVTFLLDLPSLGGVGPGTLARTLIAIAAGNLLAFLMTFLLESTAFWADNVWSLSVLLRFTGNLLGGQMLPLAVFPDWAQPWLAALPFRFLFDFPTMTLLGRLDTAAWLEGLAIGLAWIAFLAVASRLAWRRGYRAYTGVGI